MIGRDQAYTDLQLRAQAVVQRGAQDKMNVLVFAEPVDPTVKLTAMRVGFFDANNRGSSLDAPQVATYPVAVALPLGAGDYRIRIAATEASGKGGAVELKLNTNLTTAGPLRLSTLLLGAPDDKGALKPRLLFSDEEKILVLFEMYGPAAGANLKIGFELAASDDGPPTQTFRPAGVVQANEPDKFQIYGEIPIAKLEPGDYVLRGLVAIAGADGKVTEGRVLRTFRKVAK
jgi:hypothetical protein